MSSPKRVLGGILLTLFLSCFTASAQIIPNRYTLLLQDPPVSSRFGGHTEMAVPAALAYRRQIEARQLQLVRTLTARNIRVVGRTSSVLNAVFVVAGPNRLAELQALPDVAAVQPARRMKLYLNRAVALSNAQAAWTALGGQTQAGSGIKIAIIDTGIDQTHPAFQDPSLTMPTGFPRCTDSHPEDCAFTSNKVIVARSYIRQLAAGSDPNNPAVDSLPDDFSPRDHKGHGTSVASAAAAMPTVAAALASGGGSVTITGMAPKAYLGNYKVWGSPGVSDYTTDQIEIMAVEDAVRDGMDVISTSIGSSAISDYASDPVSLAFENAAKAGAVVLAAAGNSGSGGYQYPSFNTISSPSNAPSVISVGATTSSHVMNPSVSVAAAGAPASLKNIPALPGDSFFYPSTSGAGMAPLVDVATLGNDGQACSALPAGSLNGAYALIARGTCDFDTKGFNAQNAGAIGFIFYTDNRPITYATNMFEVGPAVVISNASGLALKTYLASNANANVIIDMAGIETDLTVYSQQMGFRPAVTSNMVASYSSFGPSLEGLLKPDLSAVGGVDPYLFPDPDSYYVPAPSGLYTATQNYDPAQSYDGIGLYSTNRYAAGDGTSGATPIVAGAAALVKQARASQNLRGTQIKSLLVNTTAQDVTVDDFGTQVDAEWLGAGRLDAGAAVAGIVTSEPATVSFGYLKAGALPIPKLLTLTNISNASVTLAASISCCSINGSPNGTVAGTSVGVDKTSITLAAGASTTLTVTLSGTVPAPSAYSGNVVLKQGSNTVAHIPFQFLVGNNNTVYNVIPVSFGAEGTPGTAVGPIILQLVDLYGVPVSGGSASFTVSTIGSLTLKSYPGQPACQPASSTTGVTCTSNNFGMVYADVVLGSQTGKMGVSFSAAGVSDTYEFNIQSAPSISVAGVVDAASGKSPIAPGSYVSIYGSGLANFTDTNSFTTLPMHIDFTNVTFDVPKAGISVPGRLTFVSPGQVNIQVPWELQGQTSAQMKVVLNGDLFGNVITVPIVDAAPAFFTYGSNIAIAQDSNYALVGTSNPAKRGQAIVLYCNGLGPVNNQPASGAAAPSDPLANTKQQATVTIGGQSAQVLFSGLSPGFPGLYQVNVIVPASAPTGNSVPITVAIGSATSPAATLPVQ